MVQLQDGDKMNKVFYFDIDGTITKETEGWDYKERTPRLDVIGTINKVKKDGNIVILWTSRRWIDEDITIRWLKDNNVLYDKLVMDKPRWDLYICDKSINIEQWMKHARNNM